MKKSIEFFMIVSNRAILIADYCIKSYAKVYKLLNPKYDIILRVYLNCINQNKYKKYIDKWSKYNFVRIEYSDLNTSDFNYRDGSYYVEKINKKYNLPMKSC
ncbi:MAG: hypothetical protein Q7U47_08185 [Paludibacter sp.]|nr:hypothetical protein [Paludibacter sp.]